MPSNPTVDATAFQLIPVVADDADDNELAEEALLIEQMREEADAFVRSFSWAPPIKEMLLAFGVGGVLALYLVRFEHAIKAWQDEELWVIVGDLPSMYFVTDNAERPSLALETYCELSEDWANAVLQGGDLSQVYPVKAEPTIEHAKMLLSLVSFIREKIIPDVE